jgi:hypothetical protein
LKEPSPKIKPILKNSRKNSENKVVLAIVEEETSLAEELRNREGKSEAPTDQVKPRDALMEGVKSKVISPVTTKTDAQITSKILEQRQAD